VGAGVEDVGAALEEVLGAVAVVDVVVEDGDPGGALAAEVLGGHRHVVEEAEAHGEGALGMVSGRADGGEGRPGGQRELGRPEGRLDRGPGSGEGAVRQRVVRRVEERVAALDGPPEALDVLRIVNGGDRRLGPRVPLGLSAVLDGVAAAL
jgi:hypothetical protein